MAETLGIIASIIAVIDLTGKTTSLTREYVNGVKRAPDNLRKLLDELTSLAEVFSALQVCANASPTGGLTELGIFKDKDGPLQECILELEKLLLRLESKERWRRVVTRLKWPLRERETVEFVLRIERHKSLFGLAIDADQLSRSKVIETCVVGIETDVQEIKADIIDLRTESAAQILERQREGAIRVALKRGKILTWLYPEAFDKRHLEVRERRQNNTGGWILEEPSVQGWIKEGLSSRILWGYGISGAGKTFLSSIVIDYLLDQAAMANYGMAYIYFNYSEQSQQKLVNILASLVKQLACQIQYLPEEIEDLHERLESQQKRPTVDELYHILLVVIKSFNQTFVVCDALDECDPKTQRKELLPLFHRMENDGVNLFLTSREYPEDIQESLHNSAKVRIWAKEEDIARYIKQKIEENPRVKRLVEQENCKDRIISELTASAKGMFLFVHFHIEYLCQQTTVGQILNELERLKLSSAEESLLDPTYNKAMERLLQQPKSCRNLAIRTLSWLVKAQRVLTFRELQMAVSVQDQLGSTLNERDLPDKKTLLHVCASLVTFDENNGTVGLAHYTVQEYLLRNSMLLGLGDSILATACIAFLSLDIFSQGPCTSLSSLNHRYRLYPFLDYAARNLSYHLKACSESSSEELVLRFLQNQGRISSYLQALHAPWLETHEPGIYDWYPKGQSSLHIAARLGHSAAARWLLKDTPVSVNAVDDYGQTALDLAASAGDEAVVHVLLEEGANVSISDKRGRTALFRAAVKGHETVARLLLGAGAHFSTSGDRRKELWNAIRRGQVMILRLLLEKRINASALVTKLGGTALHIATAYWRSDPMVVSVLLQNGCDLTVRDSGGHTALSHAASWGHEEVIRLLLANGADISASNNEGRSPLHQAACAYKQQEGVVQLLLDKGASIMALDHNGQTALHLAAYAGYDGAVQLLLDKGSYIMAQDQNRHTALHLAVSRKHEGTAMLLLKQGADPFALDKHGHSALDLATLNQHRSMVQLLLEKNVELMALVDSGHTALHLAAFKGFEAAVALLLKEAINPFVTNNNGRTAVQLAAYNGHISVVRLFLGDSRTLVTENEKRSILHQAAAGGNEAVVLLMLERGVGVSAVTIKGGWTALHWAVYKEKEVVVRLLLEKGGNPFMKDQNGQTSVHLAALNWNEPMVRLLLEIGARRMNPGNLGQTALHLAASRGYEAPVQLLLKKGADLSAIDTNGHTALHLAALNGHESVVRLLDIAERQVSLTESSSEGMLNKSKQLARYVLILDWAKQAILIYSVTGKLGWISIW